MSELTDTDDPGGATLPGTPPAGAPARSSKSSVWLGRKQAEHGIYDAIIVLAVILALEDRETSGASIMVAVLGALFAVVLAELYADYIGAMIGTGRRPTREEIRAAVETAGVGLVALKYYFH